MDIGVLGIVVTAVVGLVGIGVTHFYHVRAGREQKTMLGRLPDEIVDILKGGRPRKAHHPRIE